MNNPNNCSTCDYKRTPDGGWCYMFRFEPDHACALHTVPFLVVGKINRAAERDQAISDLIDAQTLRKSISSKKGGA